MWKEGYATETRNSQEAWKVWPVMEVNKAAEQRRCGPSPL